MAARGLDVWHPLALLLLAAAGTALVLDHQRLDSPTMDESIHMMAGAEYVLAGTCATNLEHPPLAKLLAGVSLGAAGARPSPGRPFRFRSPLSYEQVYAAARRPFPVLFFLLVVLASTAAGRWGGPAAGLGTAAFLAFEPNLVGHAGVIHTDVLASLGYFGTLVLVLAAIERRSLALWGASGLALGLSLAGKFSTVFLVPIVSILALVALLRDRRRAAREGRAPDVLPLLGLVLMGAVAVGVLLGVYGVALRSMPRDEAVAVERAHLTARHASPVTIERVAGLGRLLPGAGHYAAGLLGIAAQDRAGGGVNYLRGRLSPDGFWDYFFVAFAVKSSLGFLLLLALAALLVLFRRVRPDFPLLALLLSAASLFLLGTATSYNIGIRHMLPVYPLLGAAACVLVVRGLPAGAAALSLAALAALQAGETFHVHPYELSFFNAAAGGPERGGEWLNDSNLDWGQDLRRLQLSLARRGWEEKTTVAYFGGADPLATCPRSRIFDPWSTPVTPGVYAVSSFLLCAGPETSTYQGDARQAAGWERLRRALLTRGRPAGRAGYSILLFRLPPEPALPETPR